MVVEIFLSKQNVNLMLALDEKSEDHQYVSMIHPVGNMNICTKFHRNPSYICPKI